jgi:hypothetical protein
MFNKKIFIFLFIILFCILFILGTIENQFALDINSGRERHTRILCGIIKINERIINTKFYLHVKKYYPIAPKPTWRIYSDSSFILTIYRNTPADSIAWSLNKIANMLECEPLEASKEKKIIDDILRDMKKEDSKAIKEILTQLQM